jgi:hypothetical protein
LSSSSTAGAPDRRVPRGIARGQIVDEPLQAARRALACVAATLSRERAAAPEVLERFLRLEDELGERGRHAVVVLAERQAVQLEPVAAARDGIAERPVRLVHGRAGRERQRARAVVGGLVPVGMHGPRRVQIAPLEVVAIDGQPSRQAEDGEAIEVSDARPAGRRSGAREDVRGRTATPTRPVRVRVRRSGLAGRPFRHHTMNDDPHPQDRLTFGFCNTNPADISSSL